MHKLTISRSGNGKKQWLSELTVTKGVLIRKTTTIAKFEHSTINKALLVANKLTLQYFKLQIEVCNEA